jgi:hypothetical protein
MSDVLYKYWNAYKRATEAHQEAWQMALDFNQPADVRREWEKKRDQAATLCTLLLVAINFPGLTPPEVRDSIDQ